ncbi:hypothetical protein [uncultured Microbacterium sp.]|uniref:hypothetical protein n=1 Tax=uncultured Microbacterium sp. TaxID=191216 RepID=UPI0028EAB6F2|nr:hypothetical protein [uncultured Microbacterium sp.]
MQKRQSSRNYYLDFTHRSSTTDAENVVIEHRGELAGQIAAEREGPTTIHAEQTRTVHLLLHMGPVTNQRAVDISWASEGGHHSKAFYF